MTRTSHINYVHSFFESNSKKIEEWISEKAKQHVQPIYTSVDIRVSSYKIAHVDTNLFPAGFNNLNDLGKEAAVANLKDYCARLNCVATKILIIPENLTRNQKYQESLLTLKNIFESLNLEVKFGALNPETDFLYDQITVEKTIRTNDELHLSNGFKPDLIILNNDLTDGSPDILKNLKQPITPPPCLGWHTRLKHIHFTAYDQIISEFTKEFPIDPWLISTLFINCGKVNFREKQGLECLSERAEKIIKLIAQKHKEYNINDEPFLYVKADRGTFGMGVMMIKNPDEIININKKHRHSMSVIKSGIKNTEVMIQEGVPTEERVNGHSAESLAYLTGGKVAEIFNRWNDSKDEFSNLNSKGMNFSAKENEIPISKKFIAELATLAVSLEPNLLKHLQSS